MFDPIDDSFDRAKAQLKAAEARKSIRILQWRKKRSDPNKDLESLKKLDEEDKNFCEGANVQTGLLEDFKLAIRDKLEELSKPPPEPATSEEKPYLYITADK